MTQFAFFFPGQGSQSVGMMAALSDNEIVKQTFKEASDILDVDFWEMVVAENTLLNQTQHTQPLMLTAGIATWRAYLDANGAKPAMLAGHSLGEYTALVAAESISFKDALPLVKYRAEVMQAAVPEGKGAMAAVLGLQDIDVLTLCAEAANGEVLEAVNFNSPGQVVIAGDSAAVERGVVLAKEKGAKRALTLPVSVPSHCALMQPAAERLAAYLKDIAVSAPNIPVLHNTDVESHTDPEQVKEALVKQLHSPVKWVDTVMTMHKEGITSAAECGPGKVLTGLTKRIVKELPCSALLSSDAIQDFISNNT